MATPNKTVPYWGQIFQSSKINSLFSINSESHWPVDRVWSTPSKHLSTVRKNEAILLYALLKEYKINVGKIIENSIVNYYRSNYRGLIPHLTTITKLCLLGGVIGDWDEEETFPKVSPLTLTRVTKGPKNKGKKKESKRNKRRKGE